MPDYRNRTFPARSKSKFREAGKEKTEEADYLVTCLPLPSLRQISVKPEWPEAKRYVIQNMPYNSHARVIFQSRTRFWEKDRVSPNMVTSERSLGMVWSMAEEVPTRRGILVRDAAPTTPRIPKRRFAASIQAVPRTSNKLSS